FGRATSNTTSKPEETAMLSTRAVTTHRGAALAALALLLSAQAARADEASAIKALEKRGATFTPAFPRPGRPVIGVSLLNKKVSDEDLVPLRDLKGLQRLDLYATPVADTGLAHVKDLTTLRYLDLGKTRVTGKGLAHLKGHTNLEEVLLRETKVDDAGLAYLKGCKKLK